jgi:hypothetical protein
MDSEESMPVTDLHSGEKVDVNTPSPQPRSRRVSIRCVSGDERGEEGESTSRLEVEEGNDAGCEFRNEGGNGRGVGMRIPVIGGHWGYWGIERRRNIWGNMDSGEDLSTWEDSRVKCAETQVGTEYWSGAQKSHAGRYLVGVNIVLRSQSRDLVLVVVSLE